MKVVINKCFGGFGLSDAAYQKLIEWGVPVQKYIEQERDPDTGLYKPQPLNDGEVVFDRELTPRGTDSFNDLYWDYKDNGVSRRYWDAWTVPRQRNGGPAVVIVSGGKTKGRIRDYASGLCKPNEHERATRRVTSC